MRPSFFIPLFMLLVLAFSCKDKAKDAVAVEYLQGDTVIYVSSFPKEVDLGEGKPLEADLAGCFIHQVYDSLLLVYFPDDEIFWKVYSAHTGNYLGSILAKGHGENEFTYMPVIRSSVRGDADIYVDVLSSDNKHLLRYGLLESLNSEGKMALKKTFPIQYQQFEPLYPYLLMNDEVMLSYVASIFTNTREVYKSDTLAIPPHIEKLNQARVREDINTLSCVTAANVKQGLVAEGMLRLNQINLFSVVSPISKTICVGKELDNIHEVDNRKRSQRIRQYANIAGYDNYFVVLYLGISARDEMNNRGSSELQFFDWDGNPLLRLKLPYLLASAEISDQGELFVLAPYGKEEKMYRYDISQLLKEII